MTIQSFCVLLALICAVLTFVMIVCVLVRSYWIEWKIRQKPDNDNIGAIHDDTTRKLKR